MRGGRTIKAITKSTKKMTSRQGVTNKNKSKPRDGTTMALRREPNAASEKHESNQKINEYVRRNADKVRIICTWK